MSKLKEALQPLAQSMDADWEEIAKEGIDNHLGDVVEDLDPEATEEEREAHRVKVQEEAYVLALEAMTKEGCIQETAARIARRLSKEYGVSLNVPTINPNKGL